MNNRFSKKENLKSRKDIEILFSSGKTISDYPIRVVFTKKSEKTGVPINMGVTVAKKNIRLAVKRNLIKRRVREAYRLNNHELKTTLNTLNVELNIMIMYTSQQIFTYNQIEEKIKVILNRLNTDCEKDCR